MTDKPNGKCPHCGGDLTEFLSAAITRGVENLFSSSSSEPLMTEEEFIGWSKFKEGTCEGFVDKDGNTALLDGLEYWKE